MPLSNRLARAQRLRSPTAMVLGSSLQETNRACQFLDSST